MFRVHEFDELLASEQLLEKVAVDWKSLRTASSKLDPEFSGLDSDEVRHEQHALELR